MKDQAAARPRGRRQRERAFKDDLMAQSLVPGASVSAIAMKGGINANLLSKWRREHLTAARASGDASMLSVCVPPGLAAGVTLTAIGRQRSLAAALVALDWICSRPGLLAIAKAGTLEHLRENLAAGGLDWTLRSANSPAQGPAGHDPSGGTA